MRNQTIDKCQHYVQAGHRHLVSFNLKDAIKIYASVYKLLKRLFTLLTGSAVITHDVTTGTGYCLVGFSWIIDFFFFLISQSDTALHKF